jgi:hypothetical protein
MGMRRVLHASGFAAERGQVPVEFALAVGLLIFPVTILVVSLPVWIERQSAARVAAQEAAREVVLADTWAGGTERGVLVAERVAANHGIPPADVSVGFRGELERGAEVAALVTVRMPALVLPGIGSVGSGAGR